MSVVSTPTSLSPRAAVGSIISTSSADGWVMVRISSRPDRDCEGVVCFALVELPDGSRTVMPTRYHKGAIQLVDPQSVAAVVTRKELEKGAWHRVSRISMHLWQQAQAGTEVQK